jgi:TRAP-type C4-dicarboxylate transport system permease small subunit
MVIGGVYLVYTRFILDVKSAALGLPLGYVYTVLPLSGLLIMYYSILNLGKIKSDNN